MSRHKLIKNLDFDDELDDFDGGDDYDVDGADTGAEELSEEDQENMRIGTIAVRADLPPNASHITDKQIQEALWHYYYDIDKSINYLISTYATEKKKKEKKPVEEAAKAKKATDMYLSSAITARAMENNMSKTHYARSPPFNFQDFFKDTPWLNIPSDREATLIAPLYPRCAFGLMGGSSDGAPKISKLQALAAARKKKALEQKAASGSGSSGVEAPMSSLTIQEGAAPKYAQAEMKDLDAAAAPKIASRGFPLLKRKDNNPHEKYPKTLVHEEVKVKEAQDVPMEDIPLDQAEPSAFANTMFSTTSQPPTRQPKDNIFSLPYVTAATLPITTDPFSGPSPDDVVIAAQSKASGGKSGKGPAKTNGEKRADQIAAGVEAMKVDDTPTAKSKNLDVLKEYEKAEKKNAANFVVIGHVDAGKSTLMGRLLYDLHVIDERTIDRYRSESNKIGKSSFAFAWVLDQGSEERSRGITIDIATNKFSTPKTEFTILDAPGHRDFVPNMIAGASQADFAVLVIDSSTGSFESGLKGQTKEHALLVRSMGIQKLIVAVNKLETVGWSEERFLEISNQISAFLLAAGFHQKNISFIPCSGLLGDNIVRASNAPEVSWYKGPTLIQELDNSEPISRALTKPLRFTISDIFRNGTQNPLSISTRIEAGSLQTGDALLIQPSTQKCFVKSLEVDNEVVDWAVAGQNCTINLSGIEEQYLRIGDVGCSPTSPIQNINTFKAKVLSFDFLTPMNVEIHRGRLHVAGKITRILGVVDGKGEEGGKKKKVRIVRPGQVARVEVELEGLVPLEAPGRVVLRVGGETVGAGLLE